MAEPRFEPLAEIAVGNTARVELCRVVGGARDGDYCAVKRLHPHVADDPAFVDMFRDEVWMTAALKNPHVVEMLGWGNDSNGPWFAVELVRGVSLARLMKTVFDTGEMFNERLVVYIGRSICDGLAAAHALRGAAGEHLGLVHRDLTPGNVLLGFSGEIKITDFGLAKAKQRVTRTLTGLLKGNPQYMSPEQLRNEPLDARSDIFAVGVLLFELFGGCRPWATQNDFETMRAITDDAPIDLLEVRPRLDRALAGIVGRCLEKDPGQRYQSAFELGQRLEDWLDAHGYRDENESALGRFVRRNAMRQMRWFQRATDADHAPTAEVAGDPDDLGSDWATEEGPTLVHGTDHAAALVSELGGNPGSFVVEGTTVKQLAKMGEVTSDFDNLPTGRHRTKDSTELVTVPTGIGARLIGFGGTPSASDDDEHDGARDTGATVPYSRKVADQAASSSRQGAPHVTSGPTSTEAALAAPMPMTSAMQPDLVRYTPEGRAVPRTLQGLGAMPVPLGLTRSGDGDDAPRSTHGRPGQELQSAWPAASAPLPLSAPYANEPSERPRAPSADDARGVARALAADSANVRPGLGAARASAMRAPSGRGEFADEAERLRSFAERTSADARLAADLANAAFRASKLSVEATTLAARGLRSEATERLEEARRIERGVLAGQVLPQRSLPSDAHVGGVESFFAKPIEMVRRQVGDRDFVTLSMVAVAAILVAIVVLISLVP